MIYSTQTLKMCILKGVIGLRMLNNLIRKSPIFVNLFLCRNSSFCTSQTGYIPKCN